MERFNTVIFLQLCLYSITFSGHINSTHQSDVRLNSTLGEHWDVTQVQEVTTERYNRKVNITVYYETLCPASISFFYRQLRPAVRYFGERLNVHLVPYGHATTQRSGDHYTFNCQHGYPECYGNKLHACAIDVIQNNTHAVLFTTCLMVRSYTRAVKGGDYNHIDVLNWCAYNLHVQQPAISKCMKSVRGSKLLKSYGDETNSVQPPYVPFILLDDSTDQEDGAATNLIETICNILVKDTAQNCSSYLFGPA